MKTYEDYPCKIIIISNLFSIVIYLIGAYIIYQLGIIYLVLYLLYILLLEINLMRKGCTNCYYYGKFCAFGKGKISYLLFKKGEQSKFINKNMTWKDILPDFLVAIIPLIIGIVLLILNFNFLLLTLVIIFVALASLGNSYIRGSLACKFCKQRDLGCPAEKLFKKK